MNEKIGPVRYSEHHEQIRVRADAPPSETYSQETAREIDIEVKKLINDAHTRALEILNRLHDKLEKLAVELLDKETLPVADVRKLLDMPEEKSENDDAIVSVDAPVAESATPVTPPETTVS
jgi:cell division protease FtsH